VRDLEPLARRVLIARGKMRTFHSQFTIALLLTLLTACSSPGSEDDDLTTSEPLIAGSVAEVAANSGCDSSGVHGLSQQLVSVEMKCVAPNTFSSFAPHAGLSLTGSNIYPSLVAPARDAVMHAGDAAKAAGSTIEINSAFRTLAQQYVLYHSGACGTAAKPSRSNHESGKAIDVANFDEASRWLQNAGCAHHAYPGDPYHFDCPGDDFRNDSVLTFQKLWNANHPEDRLTEDGSYGTQTDRRLGRSPAKGFPTTPCQ
jgi:D-alanyl-D-alanine dipeptidase